MVFNRLPPFKSILELLSLISTLCVFRFLFPEFSFSGLEVPWLLGIPQRITGSLWFKCSFESRFVCIFRCLIFKVLLALPSRGQLTHCITHFCVCQYVFFAFFRGFFRPALAGRSRQTALLLYQTCPDLSTPFSKKILKFLKKFAKICWQCFFNVVYLPRYADGDPIKRSKTPFIFRRETNLENWIFGKKR